MKNSCTLYLLTLLVCLSASPAQAQATQHTFTTDTRLATLSRSFFAWRRGQQPAAGDDIPRVERPDGWAPDWSPEALETYRADYQKFIQSVDALRVEDWPVGQQVDARLLRAAIQRVHWELDILRSPHRNPLFYVQQTLGSVFELLLIASPVDEARLENIILRLERIPQTLSHARKNLDEAVGPFADATISVLTDIDERLDAVERALEAQVPPNLERRLHRSVSKANKALERYRRWLQSEREGMRESFAIGPEAYTWFLTQVALVPHTPAELLAQGRQEWSRAVAWDVLEQNRNRDVGKLPLFESIEKQVAAADMHEKSIRAFLESRDLMTVPDWLQHYRSCPMPAHLAPISFLGVADDLTSETRLDEDACRYIVEPDPGLSYFQLSAAKDPRPLILHEGVPGHYYQMALSWAQPNPIRRRYIDSSVNEGIAYYVEEMLLQAGLFDFSPKTREIIYSYARLRALRVEVDIQLAVGDFSIAEAAEYLARTVPMDSETALEEAVFFAFNPGQAITYQVGKLQIIRFLADARLDQGGDFSLRAFHDYLMENGNVPIALQRWEYLDRKDDVHRLDALGGAAATVPQ
ncbi:MAG: DUF885 family protein [Xanthomonadales bacterium]|nr:DUF885 family protein [Xanthomonadales bacterium]